MINVSLTFSIKVRTQKISFQISLLFAKLFHFPAFVDQKMYRGCLSDSSNERLMCDQSEEHKLGTCIRCSEAGCNNQPKLAAPKLSCLKCEDAKACAFAQDVHDAKPCEKNVRFGVKESCYTYNFNSNGYVHFLLDVATSFQI